MAGAGKKMNGKNKETKLIFLAVVLLFGAFLVVPVARLLAKSFLGDSGITTAFYKEVFGSRGFITAMGNSFLIAGTSALVTTFLAFLMAYTVHYTNVNKCFKKLIEAAAVLPMLLPTITYGFAIIYSFGREGLARSLITENTVTNFPVRKKKPKRNRKRLTLKRYVSLLILIRMT